ncbi:hypothetical protein EWH99_02855 [Sporolactobacillus sp. THM7-7]|nr:hypothetical protein EWH99_02855 [Sporolactobacillus sp. THM7-7]
MNKRHGHPGFMKQSTTTGVYFLIGVNRLDKKKLVLIGNGMAGVACIEHILKLSKENFQITIFGAETYPNYNRIQLSQVLSGNADLEEIILNHWDWYRKNHITLHTGHPVTYIDTQNQSVSTDEGLTEKYDQLIVATGSRPFILPIPGTDKKGVVTYRDISDCQKLISASQTCKKAVVIGGGLLGLEAAKGLLQRSMHVTVIHRSDYLMNRQLDHTASKLLEEKLRTQGINFLMNKETVEIYGEDRARGLRFKDGTGIEADLVVMAAGIRPNVKLARESGIDVHQGIVVNDFLESSRPNVYAVGECAEHRGRIYGLVAPAYEQGAVLAKHLCGVKTAPYTGSFLSTRLKVSGVNVFSAGVYMDRPDTKAMRTLDKSRGVYQKVLYRGDRVIGAVLFGDTGNGPRLAQMIRKGSHVSDVQSLLYQSQKNGLNHQTSSVQHMPDDTLICECNRVMKGTIVQAIRDQRLDSVEKVKKCTNASRTCGSCQSLIEALLKEVWGEKYKGADQETLFTGKKTVYDTQCPFCGVQCKMRLVEYRSGEQRRYKVVPVANPASEGRLCIKGRNAHQYALSKERITKPLLKVNHAFVPISWDQALQIIKERFTEIQKQDGYNALGVYGGGSLTNEDAYLLGKFARVALQTRYIDYNGRFCMSAASSAAQKSLGVDRGLTNGLADILDARCIILAGTNIAECQPTLIPYFTRAKQKGAFIIVIDPRETETARLADLHLKIKPGTDAALANGLLKVILDKGMADPEFIRGRTTGYEPLKQHLASVRISQVEAVTGIPVHQIEKAAFAYGKAKTGMIFTARGVEQQIDGYLTVRNFINLSLVTGKIGRPGCGYGAITGQGNGQGGREHGQKADQLPGFRFIDNPEHRSYIAKVWGINERDLPGKGVSAYEMMEKVHQKAITGLFIMGSNPVVSNPNANFVEEGLRKLKFLVVVDMFLSETGRMADLILPTSSYLEDEGTLTNLEGRVILREATKTPPEGVKHDWKILCEIAQRLGKERFFSFSSAEEIFNELRIASHGGKADYYGITYERLAASGGLYWPCPSLDQPGKARLFERTFATDDGKARILPVSSEHGKEKVTDEFPLYLTTGRILKQYLTGTQTRRSSALTADDTESFLEIHPLTAEKYHIEEGSLVKLESRRGSAVVRSRLSDQIREDTVFVPMHWGGRQNINKVTNQALDPYCKIPGFKICAVKIERVDGRFLNTMK